MAGSKLLKANEKIAGKLMLLFDRISAAVISEYTKTENAFVERYLAKDGETAETAKLRLKNKKNHRRL